MSETEHVKRQYRVAWRTYAWAYTTVEAEDEDEAIELSFQKGRASFDQNRVIERIGQLAARYD